MTKVERLIKEAKKFNNFTVEVRVNEQGKTEVVYHQTAVVTFDDETITLNDGGWITSTLNDWGCATSTTKTRMSMMSRLMNQISNQFGLGFRVYSHDWQWYAYYKGDTIPFYDSMSVWGHIWYVLVLKR